MNEISFSKCDFEKNVFFVKIRECKIFNKNFEYVHPYSWPHCHYPDYTHEKSSEMNILESKYAKICTFVIFILSFFLFFGQKWWIWNRKRKKWWKFWSKFWDFVGFLKCVIFHKILSCNYNDAKPPVGCRRGEHLAKRFKR